MIVAGKVQHAVQHQDLQLGGKVVAVALSILKRDLGGDSDVTAGRSWKREHVRGLIFVAEAAVEFAQALVACDENIYVTFHAGECLRASSKALELRNGYAVGSAGDKWIENYHRWNRQIENPKTEKPRAG